MTSEGDASSSKTVRVALWYNLHMSFKIREQKFWSELPARYGYNWPIDRLGVDGDEEDEA